MVQTEKFVVLKPPLFLRETILLTPFNLKLFVQNQDLTLLT